MKGQKPQKRDTDTHANFQVGEKGGKKSGRSNKKTVKSNKRKTKKNKTFQTHTHTMIFARVNISSNIFCKPTISMVQK